MSEPKPTIFVYSVKFETYGSGHNIHCLTRGKNHPVDSKLDLTNITKKDGYIHVKLSDMTLVFEIFQIVEGASLLS